MYSNESKDLKNADSKDLIQQLLSVTKIDKVLEHLAMSYVENGKKLVSEHSSAPSKQFLDFFLEAYEIEFRNQIPELLCLVETLYEENFTDADIKAVLEFYESPIGQKFNERSEYIQQSVTDLATSWANQYSQVAFSNAEKAAKREFRI